MIKPGFDKLFLKTVENVYSYVYEYFGGDRGRTEEFIDNLYTGEFEVYKKRPLASQKWLYKKIGAALRRQKMAKGHSKDLMKILKHPTALHEPRKDFVKELRKKFKQRKRRKLRARRTPRASDIFSLRSAMVLTAVIVIGVAVPVFSQYFVPDAVAPILPTGTGTEAISGLGGSGAGVSELEIPEEEEPEEEVPEAPVEEPAPVIPQPKPQPKPVVQPKAPVVEEPVVEEETVEEEVPPPPPPAAVCSDGIDNDRDGLTDFPADPGCTSANDDSETQPIAPKQCGDGIDNDGDGYIDFLQDPGCDGKWDDDEDDPRPPREPVDDPITDPPPDPDPDPTPDPIDPKTGPTGGPSGP